MADPVIVVGAGPTGLALAAELGLAGVPCRLLEQRENVPNVTRAFGINPRTLELLDARGLADEVLSHGFKVPGAQVNEGVVMNLSDLPTPFNHLTIVAQSGTEGVLEKRCEKLEIKVERGMDVVGLTQDNDGVDLEVKDKAGVSTIRASYVVGCDGAHSTIRDKLPVKFVGGTYDVNLVLADVKLSNPPSGLLFNFFGPAGVQLVIPFGDGYHRSISFLHGAATDKPLTLEEVAFAAKKISGHDFGFTEARWMTRFVSERRQVDRYRVGRVLLAGDAAHVNSPAGAQGMNTGIGDAMNLGWKLAATIKGTAPSWLLTSYQAERHPVGKLVLMFTDRVFRMVMVKSKLAHRAGRLLMRYILKYEPARRIPVGFLSGLSIHYKPRDKHSHKLVGHRVPFGIDVAKDLRGGKFLLVNATGNAVRIDEGYDDRVVTVTKEPLRGLPPLMLVRPDTYIAWAGDNTTQAKNAVTEWCGTAEVKA